MSWDPYRDFLKTERRTQDGNIEAHSGDHFCRAKTTNITYSECASVVLVFQPAVCLIRVIFSPVACLVPPEFSI